MKRLVTTTTHQDFGNHYGDLGVVAIAILFAVGFLFLMFGPSPLKGLDKFSAAADRTRAQAEAKVEKAERQHDIDQAVASGVISVGITPAKH